MQAQGVTHPRTKLTEYLHTAAAAEYLGVAQNTIRKWAACGELPVHRNPATGYRLFKREDLKKFLAKVARKNSGTVPEFFQQTNMEMIYQYLTGPRFRHRIQAIVEKFADMQEDLDRERKTMTKLWAKRQEQIRCVVESTAGMYGDMQGIAGKTLQEIEGLDIKLLETNEDT